MDSGEYAYIWQTPAWPKGPMTCQRQRQHKPYHDFLARTQKGALDLTPWLAWFPGVLHRATEHAQHTLDTVLARARFWQRFAQTMNARQVKLLNRLLDGFEGKRITSK